MVVAMIAVRMMEATLDKIIRVIAMRHGWMTALRTVDVPGLVALVPVRRRAMVRVSVADLDHVFIDAVARLTVQMAIVQIVDVVAVLDADMPAPRTMTMRVLFGGEVAMAGHQNFLSFG